MASAFGSSTLTTGVELIEDIELVSTEYEVESEIDEAVLVHKKEEERSKAPSDFYYKDERTKTIGPKYGCSSSRPLYQLYESYLI